MPSPLTDQDIQRIASAAERAAMRGTLRALGYVALVGGGLWLAFTLVIAAIAYASPGPGRSAAAEGWLLLIAVFVAIGAGSYYVVRSVRAALK